MFSVLPKPCGEALIKSLTSWISVVWIEEHVLLPWDESLIVSILKTTRSGCSNHREISLTSLISKVLPPIMLCRLRSVGESSICEQQAGLCPGRDCIDQLFTLDQIHKTPHTPPPYCRNLPRLDRDDRLSGSNTTINCYARDI